MRSAVILVLAALVACVSAHAVLIKPSARSSCPSCNNFCPHCLNAGGPSWVQANTPGGTWQAVETDATSAGHGLCGDMVTADGGPYEYDAPGDPVAVYTSGEDVSFDVQVTAHHRGHFEFRLCDAPDALTQTCLNTHTLERSPREDDPYPIDANHPERWYLPPNGYGVYSDMRYRLPTGFACVHCVLQWVYVTANSCNPPDYAPFFAANPGLQGWWSSTLSECGPTFPEAFWNCADVTIALAPDTTPSVTPTVSPSTSLTPSTSLSVSMTSTPSLTATMTPSPASPTPTPTPASATATPAPNSCPLPCWGHTSGPCQQANGVCWALQGGECPVGTVPCTGSSPSTATPTATPTPPPPPTTTPTPTPTASTMASLSPTPTLSTPASPQSPSNSPSQAPTPTPTPPGSPSVTPSPTVTPTPPGSPSVTPTPTAGAEAAACTGCFGHTFGPCQQSNSVCWAFVAGTQSCPVGTSRCGAVTATTTPVESPKATPTPTTTLSPGAAPSALPTPTATASASSVPPGDRTYRKMVIAYATNWAQYRPGARSFFPEDVDPTLLTHAIYAFGKMTDSYGVEPFEWNDVVDWNPSSGLYYRFNVGLKAANPQLKTLLAIGGWNFNYFTATKHLFTEMAASPSGRQAFASACAAFCREHGFDGIDLDWEYPGLASQGGRPQDVANFVSLLADMRTVFQAEAAASGHAELLLSIAVAAGASTIASGYDIPAIHPHVDWVGLMSYDLRGAWDPVTGHHTSMSVAGPDTVPTAVATWLSGTPPDKLVMGLAAYGRSWSGVAPPYGMGAAASGAGAAGPATREAGFLAFYEIQDNLDAGWTRVWDDDAQAPYAYSLTGDWVSYDDEESLAIKTAFVDAQGLGGVMWWAADLDEFSGGAYPLMRSVSDAFLDNGVAPPTATLASPSPSPSSSPSAGADAALEAQVVFAYEEGARRRLEGDAALDALGLTVGVSLSDVPATTLRLLASGIAASLPHASSRDVAITGVVVAAAGSGGANPHTVVAVDFTVLVLAAEAAFVSEELHIATSTGLLSESVAGVAAQLELVWPSPQEAQVASVVVTSAESAATQTVQPVETVTTTETLPLVVVGGASVAVGLAVGAWMARVYARSKVRPGTKAPADKYALSVSPASSMSRASPVQASPVSSAV